MSCRISWVPPALVDLAGLRDAVAEAGGDPTKVNPAVPTQLVVDHSLNVDVGGMDIDALGQNMSIEQRKNAERFEFLAWAQRAFDNVGVVMPGNGILHQINLEKFSPVVQVQDGVAFVDTLVGTDSHTTMINALGVVGWGVGGIEAESVMLGRPIWMRLPKIVGVELTGKRQAGIQATDIVLALTEYLRGQGVVGAILEFFGEGVAELSPCRSRPRSPTCRRNSAPTASMFAIDEKNHRLPAPDRPDSRRGRAGGGLCEGAGALDRCVDASGIRNGLSATTSGKWDERSPVRPTRTSECR